MQPNMQSNIQPNILQDQGKTDCPLADGPLGGPIPFVSGHWRTCVLVAAGLILAVYLASVNGWWWMGTDSGLYLNLARSLQRGQGYSLAGIPSAHVPPLFPACIAGLSAMGLGSYLALNTAMCLVGLAGILCVYFLLKCLVHRDWALVITVALALGHEMLQRSGELLSDVPFMLVITLALLLYYRGLRNCGKGWAWTLACLCLVASCWLRVVGFAAAFGAGLGLLLAGWRSARRRTILNLGLLVLGVLLSLAVFYPAYKAGAGAISGSYSSIISRGGNWSPWLRLVATPAGAVYDGSGQLSRLFFAQKFPLPLCLAVLVLPIVVGWARRLRHGDYLGPAILCCYLGAHVMTMLTVRTRYFLPIMPLLLVYFLEGAVCCTSAIASLAGRWRSRDEETPSQAIAPQVGVAIAAGLLALIVAMNLPMVGRHIYTKHVGNFYAYFENGKWRDDYELAQLLKARRIDGNVLASQTIGQLADLPTPDVADKSLRNKTSPAQLRGILSKLDAELVVLDLNDPTVIGQAVMDQLGKDAAIYSVGKLRVFDAKPILMNEVPRRPASTSTSTQSATSAGCMP